jgi:uncharacterized protein
MRSSSASPFEILAIVTICFGYFILSSINAVISGFPASSIGEDVLLGIVWYELMMGAVALLVLRARGFPLWRLVPRPTAKSNMHGVWLLIAGVLVSWIAMSPFPADQQAHHAAILASDRAPFHIVVLLSVVNGLYEEVFLLGYLQHELMQHGAAFAIGASLLVRVLYHTYQGHVGAAGVLAFGLVIAVYFARTGDLWPPVMAHMLVDVVALA